MPLVCSLSLEAVSRLRFPLLRYSRASTTLSDYIISILFLLMVLLYTFHILLGFFHTYFSLLTQMFSCEVHNLFQSIQLGVTFSFYSLYSLIVKVSRRERQSHEVLICIFPVAKDVWTFFTDLLLLVLFLLECSFAHQLIGLFFSVF